MQWQYSTTLDQRYEVATWDVIPSPAHSTHRPRVFVYFRFIDATRGRMSRIFIGWNLWFQTTSCLCWSFCENRVFSWLDQCFRLIIAVPCLRELVGTSTLIIFVFGRKEIANGFPKGAPNGSEMEPWKPVPVDWQWRNRSSPNLQLWYGLILCSLSWYGCWKMGK